MKFANWSQISKPILSSLIAISTLAPIAMITLATSSVAEARLTRPDESSLHIDVSGRDGDNGYRGEDGEDGGVINIQLAYRDSTRTSVRVKGQFKRSRERAFQSFDETIQLKNISKITLLARGGDGGRGRDYDGDYSYSRSGSDGRRGSIDVSIPTSESELVGLINSRGSRLTVSLKTPNGASRPVSSGARLELKKLVIYDHNGDGHFEPGETIQVAGFEVKNTGDASLPRGTVVHFDPIHGRNIMGEQAASSFARLADEVAPGASSTFDFAKTPWIMKIAENPSPNVDARVLTARVWINGVVQAMTDFTIDAQSPLTLKRFGQGGTIVVAPGQEIEIPFAVENRTRAPIGAGTTRQAFIKVSLNEETETLKQEDLEIVTNGASVSIAPSKNALIPLSRIEARQSSEQKIKIRFRGDLKGAFQAQSSLKVELVAASVGASTTSHRAFDTVTAAVELRRDVRGVESSVDLDLTGTPRIRCLFAEGMITERTMRRLQITKRQGEEPADIVFSVGGRVFARGTSPSVRLNANQVLDFARNSNEGTAEEKAIRAVGFLNDVLAPATASLENKTYMIKSCAVMD